MRWIRYDHYSENWVGPVDLTGRTKKRYAILSECPLKLNCIKIGQKIVELIQNYEDRAKVMVHRLQ